ncbi:hypothetical protein HHI36_007641 [Cryptolaemus montrouzieri]|uniref:Carboxypeptidase n=1 Tax=Cryptolaemus montrouzieri TaxID=559131 RepID=A0ABD2MQB4_9CUCU
MFIHMLVAVLSIKCIPCEIDAIVQKNEPLIVTDYIERKEIQQARSKCEVKHSAFLNKTSFSGYFRVNKDFKSHMFFWFFPAEESYEKAPIVLWLQGGPGDTTLISLFYENGPFTIKNNHTLEANWYSWTKMVSIIYVDNPVGTGFSFTKGGYCKNQTQIGEELYEALQQFFTLFPELIKNNFFISGVSYGGKYAMAIGHTIHQKNPTATLKINLKGISCGNAVVDPEHEINYGEYFYQLGLIDFNTKEEMQKLELKASHMVHQKKYVEGLSYMCNAVLSSNSLFSNLSGFGNSLYNLLHWNFTVNYTDIRNFISKSEIRMAIHVGNQTFHQGYEVMENLWDEMMISVAPWMVELLNHYKILVYNGQIDLIVPYPITLNYLRHLNFSGAEEYKSAKRFQWRINEDIAGYVKQSGNLTEVLVRNAGHMAIHDQPAWLYDLFDKFFNNKPYY